jgi:hypothetical protein
VSEDAVAEPGRPDPEEVDAVVLALREDGDVAIRCWTMQGRLRLSFTRVDTFEQCPRRFRYQYVDGLPQAPAPQLSFGSSLHATLEWLYDRKHPVLPSSRRRSRRCSMRGSRTGYAEVDRRSS